MGSSYQGFHKKTVEFIALCLLLASSNSKGEELFGYEIEGTVVFSGKPVKKPCSGTFLIRVAGCNWNIRFTRQLQNGPDYTEIGWDGTNLFSVTSLESNYKKLANEGKKVSNLATAYLGKNEIYRSIFDPECAMIWLTFGSKQFFDKQNQGDLLEPIISFDSQGPIEIRKKIPLFKATWKQQKQFPFLPTDVTYLDSSGDSKIITNSVFYVSSFINYQGFEFPQTAILETFQFSQQSNNSPVIEEFSKYELKLTAIRGVIASQFAVRPTLPGMTVFDDERNPHLGAVTYLNSNWVAESRITQDGFKAYVLPKKQNILPPENNNPWKRRLVLTTLLLLMLLPLLFIGKTFINKKI